MLLKFPASSSLVSTLLLLLFLHCWRFPVHGQAVDYAEELQARARTMDDLRYVIGPYYTMFVAIYWRYMLVPCDVFQQQLNYHREIGVFSKFCPVVFGCPLLFDTQSCLVQTAVRTIRFECCRQSVGQDHNIRKSRNESQPNRPGHVDDPPVGFDLESQATCNYMRAMPTSRIIGGTASRRGEFPWVAMLLKNGVHHCSCSIVDNNHCLTAAHCFDSSASSDSYEVVGGKYIYDVGEIDVGQQRISVAQLIVHEAYNADRKENDVAIVRLSQPLKWSTYVMPACLPRSDFQLPRFCVVAGWGETQGHRAPAVLMKVEMQAYTNERCLQTFSNTASSSLPDYVNENALCAANGLLGGRDACTGDSGGPLMCIQRTPSGSAAYFLFGTVSNGNQCARPGEPGVYMDVREYLAWIESAVARSG